MIVLAVNNNFYHKHFLTLVKHCLACKQALRLGVCRGRNESLQRCLRNLNVSAENGNWWRFDLVMTLSFFERVVI